MDDRPDISVVIPAHNEAGNVTALAREIAEALDGRSYEMIFVDDRSTDGTRAELVAADLIAYQMPLYQVLELRARPAGAGVPTQVQRTSPKERAATPAEVSALIRATFGAVGR